MSSFVVGQRVCDVTSPRDRATVRFVGPVGSTPGLWVGVEWDDPERRGKHDGRHEGVHYFQATRPGSGSFVREKKISGGVALGRAVRERYGAVEGANAGVEEDVLTGLRKEINAPFLEVVGFDKVNRQQSDFSRLRVVSVRATSVCGLRSSGLQGKEEDQELHRLAEWMPMVRRGSGKLVVHHLELHYYLCCTHYVNIGARAEPVGKPALALVRPGRGRRRAG